MLTAQRTYRLKQCAILGALVGVLLSQYHPLWGSPAQLRAEPWSPVRKTLGGSHVALFALLGLAVGGVIIQLRDE
ncbi:MAG: hypothetical protein EOO75_16610 [Myxococcales bacterium]|nr:MAG: hypothetical protein EOO75_16610 [Myxococcales bacterium]